MRSPCTTARTTPSRRPPGSTPPSAATPTARPSNSRLYFALVQQFLDSLFAKAGRVSAPHIVQRSERPRDPEDASVPASKKRPETRSTCCPRRCAMSLPPVYEILRKHRIRFVTNATKWTDACPKCGSKDFSVQIESGGVDASWHCDACGFSRPPRAQPDGRGATRSDADEKRRLAEALRELEGESEQEPEPELEPEPAPEPEPKRDEPQPEPKPSTIAEAARDYHERGWKPVPIDRQTKRASGKEWQKRAYDPKQFRGNAQNVGVQLGVVSGGLADVDLDCAEAIALAPKFLPPTDAIFGRKSKPASHRLYVTDLCETVVGAVIQFPEYVGGKSDAMLVELRVGGKRKRKGKNEDEGKDEDEYEYTGATSVFPPSLHASSETVTWVCDGEPAKVAGDELVRVVRKLAVASLLKRHYPGDGSRHKGALAIGGVLVHAGWNADAIGQVVEQAARAAGDDEVADRVTTAKGAVGANANGIEVAGLQSAREAWGDIVADTLGHWLKMRALRPDKGVGLEDRVALDFAAKHTDGLRYIAKSGQWMRWTGNHWQEEPTTTAAFDEARKLCRPAGDARAKTVNAVTVLGRADRRIAATAEQWDAGENVFNLRKE